MRKAPTNPHTVRQQHRRLHTVRQQHHRSKTEGASKVVRDGDSGNSLRQSVSAQSTWSGCEVELGTCHCLPYDVHLVHTRVPMESHRRRQRIYPLWWCSTARSVRRNHFSRHHGDRNGKQKPTPALQHLEPGRLLLGENTSEGQQGCGPTGRTARISWRPWRLQQPRQHDPLSYSTAFFQGIGFHRRQLFQVALLPDPSGHTSGCLE